MSEIINLNDNYERLIGSIEEFVYNVKSINNTMVETYWNIGKYIIEFE